MKLNASAAFLLGLLTSCMAHPDHELESRLGGRIGPGDPGISVLVLKDGRVLLEHCQGLADLDPETAIGSFTNFRLASVTKQFTATAVMILRGEESVSLDQNLTDFFPEFPPYGKKVTVRQLLTHTSGLADYESLMPDSTTVPVLDHDVLRLLETQDSTLFEPGTQFRYSNSGYALLALIVERRSGMSFAEFLREKIFAPLAMDNTVAFERGISEVSHRAYGHSPDAEGEGRFRETDQSLTSSVLGDGGVYSSLDDLRRWAEELDHPTVLGVDLLEEAMRAHVSTLSEGESYGYGWYVAEHNGLRQVRHSGSTIGFRTELQRYPEIGLTVIILANRSDLDVTEIATALADRVIREELD